MAASPAVAPAEAPAVASNYRITCSLTIDGADLATALATAGNSATCLVIGGPGGFSTLTILAGQTSITSDAVYPAGSYPVTPQATIGGVTYRATPASSTLTITSADVTLSATLTS